MSDFIILTASMVVLSLIKCVVVGRLSRYLMRMKGMKMSHLEIVKFRIAVWKSTYYTSIVLYAIFALKDAKWLFKPAKYAYFCTALSLKYRMYYLVSLSYYFNEFITIFIEPRKKDFLQMLAHHVATIVLILLSYSKGLTRYGLAILILHDIADPWLEIAKVNLTLKNNRVADVFFFIFMVTFVVLRIGIYPYFIVVPATRLLLTFKLHFWNSAISAMLNALIVIHLIWSFYISKVFVKILKNDSDVVDARSEEEDLPK